MKVHFDGAIKMYYNNDNNALQEKYQEHVRPIAVVFFFRRISSTTAFHDRSNYYYLNNNNTAQVQRTEYRSENEGRDNHSKMYRNRVCVFTGSAYDSVCTVCYGRDEERGNENRMYYFIGG